jgi:hypothetical protein
MWKQQSSRWAVDYLHVHLHRGIALDNDVVRVKSASGLLALCCVWSCGAGYNRRITSTQLLSRWICLGAKPESLQVYAAYGEAASYVWTFCGAGGVNYDLSSSMRGASTYLFHAVRACFVLSGWAMAIHLRLWILGSMADTCCSCCLLPLLLSAAAAAAAASGHGHPPA